MSDARERILQRLRIAAPADALPRPDVGAFYAAFTRQENAAARLAHFRAAMEAAHTEIHDTTEALWPALLARIAQAKGLSRLLTAIGAADADRLDHASAGALVLLRSEGPSQTWRAPLFADVQAGLTRARSAIAETGSLIVWPGPNEPRLASLVPPVHFVLLDATRMHAHLHAAMCAEGWAGGLPTNALLISGPSKTADIQQTLAYGAHGPRELVLLLCHPATEEVIA